MSHPSQLLSTKRPDNPYRFIHWIAYGLLIVSFCVALTNVWLKEETTKYAFKLGKVDKERIALDNEIHKLTVQLEELRAPSRISAIAEELGMELLRNNFIEIKADK